MAAHDNSSKYGGSGDWLRDRAFRALIGAALALPYTTRVPLMGAVMRRVIAPLAGFRYRALTNLAYIYPDMPITQRRQLADEVADNACRTLIENYATIELAQRAASAPISGSGLAAIETARAAGRPVLFVTGHFGNYEAPRHALNSRGYVIGAIYRAMKNPFINDHYVRTIAGVSGPVFEKGRRGTMGFTRLLKSGGMAAIMFDVYDKQGAMIDFLGQPAPTSISAATLALKYDALLVPYFGIRQPDGLSFDIAIEEPIAHSDPLSMTREMTRRLEARIAKNPGQWFWIHKRWKPERNRPA